MLSIPIRSIDSFQLLGVYRWRRPRDFQMEAVERDLAWERADSHWPDFRESGFCLLLPMLE